MPDPNTESKPDATLTLWPLPETRHVYLLAAGIVLGVLLGPAVLGRALPGQYDRWFNAGGDTTDLDTARERALALQDDPGTWVLPPDIEQEINQYEALAYEAMEARLETMREIEVTPQAIDEHRAQSERTILEHRTARETRAFERQLERQRGLVITLGKEAEVKRWRHRMKLVGIQMALILALVAFAIAEALLAPAPGSAPGSDASGDDPGSGGSDGAAEVGSDSSAAGARVVSPRLAHLVTVRYALLAGWLTLALAQPAALRAVSPVFAAVLVLVVLVAGFVPLGKKAA